MIRRASAALGLFLDARAGGVRRRRRDTAPSTGASAPPASVPAPVCALKRGDHRRRRPIKDLAFDPSAITAKVGDVIAFTNDDSRAHRHTGRGRLRHRDALERRDRRPDVQHGRDLSVPLRDPLVHDGDDHRHRVTARLAPGSRSGRALGDEQRGARRQVDERRLRQLGLGEPRHEPFAGDRAVPWYNSSSWTPAINSPCRVRNSSRSSTAAANRGR